MSLISPPLFKSDNTEQLTSADAYDITSTRPINKLFDAAKGVGSSLIDRAGGIRGIANGITSIARSKAYGLDGKGLLEQSLGIFGTSSAGIIRTAGVGILEKAGGFLNIDPSTIANIKNATDSVATQVQYGDFSDIGSYGDLVALMGSLTGNEALAEYINIGYESAVWGAVLSEAVGYGADDYLSRVKEYIDPAVYHQSLIYSVPAVASSGDLSALSHLRQELTVDEILAAKDDFIKIFLMSFKIKRPMTETMDVHATTLFTAMSELDGRWYLFDRNGTDIIDMKYMAYMSKDAQAVLELHPVIGFAVQMAPKFPDKTAGDVVRENYPLMVDVG